MSYDSSSTSSSMNAGPEAAPLDWLLSMLREAIVGVMADDQPASKKANALARLGSLYLKTYEVAELKRANAELEERVTELEERLTTAEAESGSPGEVVAGQAAPDEEGGITASMTVRNPYVEPPALSPRAVNDPPVLWKGP
jgi:hypothetical protein